MIRNIRHEQKHLSRSWRLQLRRRGRAYLLAWLSSSNQNGSQSEPNQFPYQMNIWCRSLLRSNHGFKGGSLQPEICFHFVAPTKNTRLKTWPCFVGWRAVYFCESPRECRGLRETEQQHSTEREHIAFEGELPSEFWSGHMNILSDLPPSFAIIQNWSQIQGQEHTFPSVPFLNGYKMLLPGSAGSNMSLCGFKDQKNKSALPDGTQV